MRDRMRGGGHSVNEVEWAHADRLAELVLEQIEMLDLSEYGESWVLTIVARQLIRRTVELGEVIEAEARELNDLTALQMATAMQSLGPAADRVLEEMERHSRFGLAPSPAPTRLPPPPQPREASATGTDDGPPRPLYPRPRARSRKRG
jgi:hypothetical protein